MPKVRGMPKTLGSGRKTGTPNKATLIMASLEPQEAIMKMLEDEARNNKSINAACIWLEYNAKIGTVVEAEVDTLEDIKNAGALITKKMLRNELSFERGAKAHEALTKQKSYIEGQLTPELQKILAEQEAELKMRA